MKKNLSVLLIFIVISCPLFAQKLTVTDTRQLNTGSNNEFYYPQMTADGSKILFSSANYKGIWYADLNTGLVSELTGEEGAGYAFSVSEDGRSVYYRTNIYNGSGLRVSQQIKEMNIISQLKNIVAEGSDLSVPVLQGKSVFYTSSGKPASAAHPEYSAANVQASVNTAKPSVFIENQKIALYINGQNKILAPLGEGNYIWPSVSPDGSRLLFTLAGKGTFVSDLNGRILFSLGYANSPKWSPDGKWIIFMNDKDDHVKVVSSDIYAASAATGEIVQLTFTEDIHEMYPEWNSENKVVFNSSDGKIFIMELKAE